MEIEKGRLMKCIHRMTDIGEEREERERDRQRGKKDIYKDRYFQEL